MRPAARALCAAFVAVIALAVEARAYIGAVVIDPAEPDCTEAVRLRVTGEFWDSCFEVLGHDLEPIGDLLYLKINVLDRWDPDTSCLPVIVGYDETEIVGSLPLGAYTLDVVEEVTSLRYVGERQVGYFDVSCCDAAPGEVDELKMVKEDAGRRLAVTWSDVATTESYVLYKDAAPDGPFDIERSSTPAGTIPLRIEAPADTTFYRMGARNSCGDGPV